MMRGRDQMAGLEQSFNSMTGSLAKLVNEQKEKQRLESELAIAYEVQDLFFPRKFEAFPHWRSTASAVLRGRKRRIL